VEELLGLVCLGRDPRALAQLQHRLVCGCEIATRPRDEEPLLAADQGKIDRKPLRNRSRQPRDVLAVERGDRRDRACVARRVAPALLDLRRADDDLVAKLGDRPVRLPGDEPARPSPGTRRLERERRLALVRDDDEEIGVAFGPQDQLERLHRFPTGHRCVERGPAAGEEEPPALGEAAVRRHLRQPLGLCGDRPSWSARRAQGVGLYDRRG
jgi:hypothetical protein